MRICIYGAGAMGSSMGEQLVRAGVSCDLVTRNRAQVDALLAAGYFALLPQEMEGRYDVIFLATRQGENGAIANFLKDRLAEDGALVTVQNGLPEAGLAEVLGEDRVYGCALGWGAEMRGCGVAEATSREKRFQLALGSYGTGERLGEIAALLSKAFTVRTGALAEIRYGKLVINAAFSTLSAISGLDFGTLAKKYRNLIVPIARETIAVAKAQGCNQLMQNGHDLMKFFSGRWAGPLLPIAMRRHRRIRSGMLKDLEAGRRCDVDFVAGAVVRAGKAAGVNTPLLENAIKLLHEVEAGACPLSPATLRLLKEK